MRNNLSQYKPASQEEIQFLRHNMPRGMVAMINIRTNEPRWRILYELERYPINQNLNIIQAAREILFAVTGLDFDQELNKRKGLKNS